MSDFGLDLASVEEKIDEEHLDGNTEVVLGVLNGTTDPDDWVEIVSDGNVLVLAIEGNLEELADELAREIMETGGDIVHFRSFLIIAPPAIDIDNDRLG